MSSTYIVKDSRGNILSAGDNYQDTQVVARQSQSKYAFIDMEEWDGVHLLRTFRFAVPKDDWAIMHDYIEKTRMNTIRLRQDLDKEEQKLAEMMKGENR